MNDTRTRATFPAWLRLTGEGQTLRRTRVSLGKHRTWTILPRYGTADSDRWTLIGTPTPAALNPAADYEDGQYASLAEAYAARDAAEREDDGTHEEVEG